MLDVSDFMPVVDFDRFSLGKRPKRPSRSSPWADTDRVDELKRRWASGETCSVIAAGLGGDITRNAVIGKLHRLGLKSRDNDIRVRNLRGRPQNIKGRIARAKPRRAAPQPKPRPAAPLVGCDLFDATIPRDRIKSLMDRPADVCCWPIGDPRQPDFGYCCAAVAGDRPYCADHLGYMVQRVPGKRATKGGSWGAVGVTR
jgi:GcrA cell cycle regulator